MLDHVGVASKFEIAVRDYVTDDEFSHHGQVSILADLRRIAGINTSAIFSARTWIDQRKKLAVDSCYVRNDYLILEEGEEIFPNWAQRLIQEMDHFGGQRSLAKFIAGDTDQVFKLTSKRTSRYF